MSGPGISEGDGEASDLGSTAFRVLIVASLALGAALRAFHLTALKDTTFFSNLILDAEAYDAWAQRVANGQLIGEQAFWIDPLYAYALGGVYALFGHDLMIARVFNAVLGLGAALLIALITLRAVGSRIAAVAACLAASVFVPGVHFDGQVEKTALTLFTLALAVYCFLGGTQRSLSAAGVATGLATLARGNVLLFMPVGALALLCGWDREPSDPLIATAALRRKRALIFVVSALPVLGLATAHNLAASGELVPITSNLGINLYIGNHLDNRDGSHMPPPFLHPSSETEQPGFRAEAERRTGERLSDRALSSYWAVEALKVIASEPGYALGLAGRKLLSIVHNGEVPDSESAELLAHWSRVLGAPVLWFGQLLPLAVFGAAQGFRRRGVRVLVAIAVLYAATLMPFFVLARLRMPMIAALAPLAGAAVAWLVAAIDRKRLREGARGLALATAVAAVCFYEPEWMTERAVRGLAIGWHNLGLTLEQKGEHDKAIRAHEQALAVRTQSVPGSARALGALYLARGDYERAEEAYRTLVTIKPTSASGRAGWRSVFQALLRAGETDRAIALLQRAVETGPYDEGLSYLLGQTMERYGSPQAMVDFFAKAAARDDKPQTSHYFWAVGLARSGDTQGALKQLERALEIDPAHEMSQHRIGMLLEQQGDLEGALARYEEAARILPEYKGALESAARLAEQLGKLERGADYRRRAASADPNSPRRYVHWARYLYRHGRSDAALAELDRMFAERPDDAEALRLRDQILGGGAPSGPLDASARQRMIAVLEERATPAVLRIAHDGRYPAARELADAIAEAFTQAGWTVRVERAAFALKPGIAAYAGSYPPIATTAAAIEAIKTAAIGAAVRPGYREYSTEMKAKDPAWLGFILAADEDLILALGDPTR